MKNDGTAREPAEFGKIGMKRTEHNSLSVGRGKRARRRGCSSHGVPRRLRFECLEDRRLLAAAPFGAFPDDTAEYMLGDVLVSVVLMESSSKISSVNQNTENWTPATIAAVKQKVQTGIEWWEQTLVTQFPNSPHPLDFHFDFHYADHPVLTDYEPISLPSDYFQYWMYDFLKLVGHNQTGNFTKDIRAFNHAQRLAHGTDWAFTVFVVNDTLDADGKFAAGGSFEQAFSYAGGQFFVSPAKRPPSTFAHETGHMFWARDEYLGGGSYTDRRGYYNAQNWNAANNPTPGFTQVVSIMRENPLDAAYNASASSPSSLAMIGWRDSDGNGIFDVLDVPHTLSGTGYLDPVSGQFRFLGTSSVQTLPNLNSSGLQNDITLNKISRAEYRVNGGAWQTAAVYGTSSAVLDLAFPVPSSGNPLIEIRTVDATSGVSSPVFQGHISRPASVLQPGVNGFVWNDLDADANLDNGEPRLAGWTVRLVDSNGVPLELGQALEPDNYATGMVLNTILPQVTLSLVGDPQGAIIASVYSVQRVFGSRSLLGTSAVWKPGEMELRMDFAAPVTSVRLDAIGTATGDRARLEAYDRSGNLIGRTTTGLLPNGQLDTMRLDRPTADIAYVIAKAHSGVAVRLDNLRFGPETVVRTDLQGAYAITGLPAGGYFVEAVTPSGRALPDSRRAVSLAEGEALGAVDLVAQSGTISWQNPLRPADVTGDGHVTPQDALVLINYINAHGGVPSLPNDLPPPYFDVDGNGLITAADVLQVINLLNQVSAAPSGASGESPAGGFAEGEAPAIADRRLPASDPPSSAAAGNQAAGTARLSGTNPAFAGRPRPSAADTRQFCRTTRPSNAPPEIQPAAKTSDDAELESLLRLLADDLTASGQDSATSRA